MSNRLVSSIFRGMSKGCLNFHEPKEREEENGITKEIIVAVGASLDDQTLFLGKDLHSNPLYCVSLEEDRHFARERVVLVEVVVCVAIEMRFDGR